MIKFKSSLLFPIVVALASTSLVFDNSIVEAAEVKTAIEKKTEVTDEKWLQFEQDLESIRSQIGKIDKQAQQVESEIKQLDDEVAIINENIRNLEPVINTAKGEMDVLESEIKSLEVRIEKREKVIRQRLRTMQRQGGEISYLEVFLGVKSFAEFLETTGVVNTILEADKIILETQTQDQKKLKVKEKELLNKLATLDENLKKEESLKLVLQEKIAEKNKIMESLKEQKTQSESEVFDLYEVYDLLTSQELAILKEYEAKKSGLGQLKTESVFMKPTAGSLTSGYGLRWQEHHAGVDLSDPASDTVVLASASGTVIRSYYSTSYGNCVFITHNINGKIYTTVYAHLENRLVTTGQTLTQGQIIGYMGNTGHSFGKHLHFEIHQGPWNIDKSNSIDPTLLVDFK